MNDVFLNKLIETEGITVEKIGKWIWVSGNTKPLKNELKENDFRWARKKERWYFHEGTYRRYGDREYTMEEIKHKYICQTLRRTEAV